MIEICLGIGLVFLLMGFADEPEKASEFIQSLWGGKVRELKKENKRLKAQLEELLTEDTQQLRARVETIEDIVTSDELEINRKISRLK